MHTSKLHSDSVLTITIGSISCTDKLRAQPIIYQNLFPVKDQIDKHQLLYQFNKKLLESSRQYQFQFQLKSSKKYSNLQNNKAINSFKISSMMLSTQLKADNKYCIQILLTPNKLVKNRQSISMSFIRPRMKKINRIQLILCQCSLQKQIELWLIHLNLIWFTLINNLRNMRTVLNHKWKMNFNCGSKVYCVYQQNRKRQSHSTKVTNLNRINIYHNKEIKYSLTQAIKMYPISVTKTNWKPTSAVSTVSISAVIKKQQIQLNK